MAQESIYTVLPECIVRELGGKFLLLVYPEGEPPYALDVNESFAGMFKWAKEKGPFSAADLADFLESEYALAPEQASSEAHATIELWKENSLISG